MRIHLIAIGRYKSGSLVDLVKLYQKRLKWKFELTEIQLHKNASSEDECEAILKKVPDNCKIIALDERGKTISSDEFAHIIESWQVQSHHNVTFIIGGADGLNDKIRKKADFLLSFGKQTWPHQLVRVMLIEQVYRVQQILSGHPYHRS